MLTKYYIHYLVTILCTTKVTKYGVVVYFLFLLTKVQRTECVDLSMQEIFLEN